MKSHFFSALKCRALLILLISFSSNLHAFEVNRNAVVLLIAQDAKKEVVSTGTGIIVDTEGTLITNYHLLVDAHSMQAIFPDGNKVEISSIAAVNRSLDFAILRLKKGLYSTLEIGDSNSIETYAYTSALGYPFQGIVKKADRFKGQLVRTHGFVLGILPQALPDQKFIYTTTPFEPGFSGGPVLNSKNQVVGLATLEGRAINLAIPINAIKSRLQKLKQSNDMSFKKLRDEDQTSKEALLYKANFVLHALGDPKGAVDLYNQALKLEPDYIPALYESAVANQGLGEIDKAIALYEKAISLNPNFPEALSNLGGQYFRQGKADLAVKKFKKAISVYPNFIQALSNLGAVLNKQGKPGEALPYLEKALSLDPEFAITYFNQGNALLKLNRLSEAEESFKTAVAMGVDFMSLHWGLYEIYEKKDRKKEALAELQLILEMDPGNPDAKKKLSAIEEPSKP